MNEFGGIGMVSELHLIWNPVAGNGAAVSAYQLVTDALAERGTPFSSEKSEYAGHATELAKQAIADGVKKIVVLGGDGMEHLGHFLRLLAFRDVLEAEMGGGFLLWGLARVAHVALTG